MQFAAFLLPVLATLALAADTTSSHESSTTRASSETHKKSTHRETATESTRKETAIKTHTTSATATYTGAANAFEAADMGVIMAGVMGAAAFLG